MLSIALPSHDRLLQRFVIKTRPSMYLLPSQLGLTATETSSQRRCDQGFKCHLQPLTLPPADRRRLWEALQSPRQFRHPAGNPKLQTRREMNQWDQPPPRQASAFDPQTPHPFAIPCCSGPAAADGFDDRSLKATSRFGATTCVKSTRPAVRADPTDRITSSRPASDPPAINSRRPLTVDWVGGPRCA